MRNGASKRQGARCGRLIARPGGRQGRRKTKPAMRNGARRRHGGPTWPLNRKARREAGGQKRTSRSGKLQHPGAASAQGPGLLRANERIGNARPQKSPRRPLHRKATQGADARKRTQANSAALSGRFCARPTAANERIKVRDRTPRTRGRIRQNLGRTEPTSERKTTKKKRRGGGTPVVAA